MKKSLLLLAAAAMVVGCSKNEILNEIVPSEVAIGFGDSYIGKKVKSGEVTNLTDLQTNNGSMKVWGWKTNASGTSQVFNNQEVTYNSSSTRTNTKWEYTPLKFWDMEATNYKFYAVSPNTDKFVIDATTRIISSTSVDQVQILADNNGSSKVTSSNTQAKDYLIAAVVDKAPKGNDSDDDVTFTFSHILSKLAIKVKTTSGFENSGSNYPQIKLTDLSIKLSGMCPNYTQAAAGTVNPASDTWTGTGMTETTYTCFDVAGDVTDLLLTGTANEIASYLVSPTTTAGTTYTYKVSVEYDIYYAADNHEHFTATDKTVSTLTTFTQNTSNTLTVTIDPQAIYFDVQSVGSRSETSGGTVLVQ